MRASILPVVACVALFGACSEAAPRAARDERPASTPAAEERSEPESEPLSAPRRVDPRKGGLEITLGEWAITPESDAIRPGPVTFVIENRGTVPHGFEIELEGDSSGHGSGDLFKAESRLLQPGDSTHMTFDLGPAVYKIECLVDGHDDMGMEGLLDVRDGAPLVTEEPETRPGEVTISDFAFAPATLEVSTGTEVSWTNADPTDHTVTAFDGGFGSEALSDGATFSHTFSEPGTYPYRCAIHPDMEGKVKVE
jgi:plastocyanin